MKSINSSCSISLIRKRQFQFLPSLSHKSSLGFKRCYTSSGGGGSSSGGFPGTRPGPPPLNPAQQREIDDLIKAEYRQAMKEQLESDSSAKNTATEPESNVNPATGEINGPKGPEPTRYGDWERKGRVYDF